MGMLDFLYIIVFLGLLEGFMFFKVLFFSVFIVSFCFFGCEGSVMVFVMFVFVLFIIISGYFGVVFVEFMGVFGDDFFVLLVCLLIEVVCMVLLLFCLLWIKESKGKEKKEE